MNNEPNYSRQTGELANSEDLRRAWITTARMEAEGLGCTYHRSSYDDATGTLLHEAWKAKPEVVPEPRFFYTKG